MGEAAAKEPTMEDILSSIRRIIAQDDEPQQSAAPDTQAGAAAPGAGGSSTAPGAVTGDPAVKRQEPRANARPSPPQSSPRPAMQASTPPQRKPEGNMGELAALAGEITGTVSQSPALQPRPAASRRAPQPEATGQAAPVKPASVLAERSAPAADAETRTVPRPGEFKSAIVDVEEPARTQNAEPARPTAPAPHESSGRAVSRSDHGRVAPPKAPASGDREARNFKRALVSPSTEDAVSGSMDRLKKAAIDDAEARVEAVLRPMLREWLDENLPDLVERLVREEISRIAKD